YTDNSPLHTKTQVLYRIGISNPGGCNPGARTEAINYNASKSNTGNITFNPSLSVNTITSPLNSLQIFPNPSTGLVTFTIELPNNAQDLSLTVINTLGQEVMTQDFSRIAGEFTKQIDLSQLAKGVYFAKLKYGNNTVYRKVVLQ
ncbi:MAG TPA: T9SS type A sorting domain-containing protein, partial [Bacteroidia bacterium]|nr:T9SS type A sorting domain-containing protein [Bacteroidia bacterium]